MKRSTDRILTHHTGRLPNPSNQAEIMQARNRGDQQKFDELTRAAIGPLVQRQKDIGIDVMSDGEFWKVRDQQWYDDRCTGVTTRPLKPGEVPFTTPYRHRETRMPEFKAVWEIYRQIGSTPRPGPDGKLPITPTPTTQTVVSGPIKPKSPEAARHEVQVVKDAIVAAGGDVEDFSYPVIGPGWLGHFVENEYYQTEEEYVYAIADMLRNDYLAVIEAGFNLQIDDPSICTRIMVVDPPISIEEYQKQYLVCVEALNHALEGIPEERTLYHACWGGWHAPHSNDLPFRHIIDLLLKVKVGAYSVAAADPQHELDRLLWENHKLPEGRVYIPGVIAHTTSTVEPPELVADRIIRYANVLGKENVIAGVDCGVGSKNPDIAWAKLNSLVQGAALASKQLWGVKVATF